MDEVPITASFSSDPNVIAEAAGGQLGHRDHIAHGARFERRAHRVRPGVWSVVGNGLSNQNFVEGPDGLIAIDSGESVEEMRWALEAVRDETDAPVAAVVYTHYHYVSGTTAVDGAGDSVPVWGHERIVANRRKVGVELSAAAGRGLVHQFGMMLPDEGPDGLINVGLGREFRRADHAPFTPGFVAPTDTIDAPTTTTLAGLRVELTPAPSDADDSITIWIPEVGVCVNNLAWPALFNVFAIRGEEFRNPNVLLAGYDHLLGLGAEHMLGAHGPPISGRDRIHDEVTLARDAIQFLLDQTVRGVNKGMTLGELTSFVQLPEPYGRSYFTQQLYGVAEHHVRQIHNGLRGWFDGDESTLFPLPPAERAIRLVDGFGGAEAVRGEVTAAIARDDLRWALELATWLVRRSADEAPDAVDRQLLADALRAVAQRTTAANIRNWCLTRALELEGRLDLDRFRTHRFGHDLVRSTPPAAIVSGLRVVLDPEAADDLDDELRWRFSDGSVAGLRVRNRVAVPTDGGGADVELAVDVEVWPDLLSGRVSVDDALAAGSLVATGDVDRIKRILGCFDLPGFAR